MTAVAEAMPASPAVKAAATRMKSMVTEMSWSGVSGAVRCGGYSHRHDCHGESVP
jgi:hypothetical protein